MDEKDKLIAELKTQLDAKNKDLAVAEQTVAELKTLLAEQTTTVDTVFPTLSVGKKTYELTEPAFNYGGSLVNLQVLQENPKLAEELVREGVSYLRRKAE